jgi:O-antigen ligase
VPPLSSNVYTPARNTPPLVTSSVKARGTPKRLPALLRYSFLLFVFTIPIEALNKSLSLGPVSLARVSGLLVFGLSVVYFKRCYSHLPRPFWCFVGFLSVFVLLGLFIPAEYKEVFGVQLYTRIQLVAFFLIASNLLRDESFARKACLTFAFATVFFGLAIRFQLPGFTTTTNAHEKWGEKFERTYVDGINPDHMGTVFLVGGIILIGLVLERFRRVYLVGPLILVLSMIVFSGSRASTVAFVVGVACYLLPFHLSVRKVIAIVVALVVLAGLGYQILNSPDMMSRLELAKQGDSAGRDQITKHVLDMISERPLLGWGPVAYGAELQLRKKQGTASSFDADAHNLLLNILIEVGVLGGFPFALGIALCCSSAWKSRHTGLGMLPLALIVAMMVNLQFSYYATAKPLWFVLALGSAASAYASKQPHERRRRQSVMRRQVVLPKPALG